ncbi:MAG: hypothetical protein RR945_05695 [Erysipelotrichaceae bacterium]
MFWDIYDLWGDSNQTLKVKALRRKSNYYEDKYDDLNDYLSTINKLLGSAENTYGLYSKTISCANGNVLQHTYYESESNMYNEADSIITLLEGKRDIIKQQKNSAYDLYRYYYNRAIKEDY